MVHSGRSPAHVVIACGVFLLMAGVVSAQQRVAQPQLAYRFVAGDRYRIVGTNRQTVWLNGTHIGTSKTLTRIQTHIRAADGSDGHIEATYQVSEESAGAGTPYQLSREYGVEFTQRANGEMEVEPASFVPQVRNVPTFVNPHPAVGERWHAPALDVYDFRDSFGIAEPVSVPFNAFYEYVGPQEVDGVAVDALKINYNLYFRPPVGSDAAAEIRLITGRFEMDLNWDSLRGRAHAYQERYTLAVQLTDGRRFEFRGEADATVIGVEPLNRTALRDELLDAIETAGDRDTRISEDERGLTIVMENIQFPPDSAELLESERLKLQWIGAILARYPERDLLISGHTALAGTELGRQQLSEARAAAVGGYLLELGVRERDRMLYQGFGARQPVADNTTEDGRRRNRRVEITILEN